MACARGGAAALARSPSTPMWRPPLPATSISRSTVHSTITTSPVTNFSSLLWLTSALAAAREFADEVRPSEEIDRHNADTAVQRRLPTAAVTVAVVATGVAAPPARARPQRVAAAAAPGAQSLRSLAHEFA